MRSPELLDERRLTPKNRDHITAALPVAIGFSGLFGLQLLAIAVAGRRSSRLLVVLALFGGACFQGLGLATDRMPSTDLYSYVSYGRLLAVHGLNPYLASPSDVPWDPFYARVYWKFVPSFYGPAWTLISAGLALLGGEDVDLTVHLFRGVPILAALLTGVLVVLIARQVDPTVSARAAIGWLWSPLVVVESGVSGHNDALVSLGVAAGIWLVASRWSAAGIAAATAGAMVKLSGAIILPLLGLRGLRQTGGWLSGAALCVRSALAVLAVAIPSFAAVWAGPETLAVGTLGAGADRYTNALAEPLLGALRLELGESIDDVEVPLQFVGWWVATHAPSTLRAGRSDSSRIVGEIPPWNELLVLSPERDARLRVLDPYTHRIGYVVSVTVGPSDRPDTFDEDQMVLSRERGPMGSATLHQANALIRRVGWGALGLALLLGACFGTGSTRGLLVAWSGVMLVLHYVGSTWYWPWYVMWSLPAAALIPGTWIGVWTLLLSWSSMLLYSLLGFGETAYWPLQTFRSAAVFGLPVLGLAVWFVARFLVWVVAFSVRLSRPSRPASPA
ncbi:MAG: hypothetical protein U0821_03025 [Chloroflexota bacterium]